MVLLAAAAALVLAGCVTGGPGKPFQPSRPTHYTVLPGDTLSGIARRVGLDYRDIARWNRLSDPSVIYPGQRLTLVPPKGGANRKVAQNSRGSRRATSTSTGKSDRKTTGAANTASGARSGAAPQRSAPGPVPSRHTWRWPADGPVLAAFDHPSTSGRGIHLGGREGDDVRAAAGGRVVYSGSGLIGYGNLVIIKHDETFLSAYGYNSQLLVAQGDEVRGGQRIARMGLGPSKQPMLHFEIRIEAQPVDPSRYLPARASP